MDKYDRQTIKEAKENMARRILVFDGHWYNVPKKVIEEQIRDLANSFSDKIAIREIENNPGSYYNNMKDFGIRAVDFKKFSYNGLKNEFYGLHNINPGNKFLFKMNPAEIIALYMGAGFLKYVKEYKPKNRKKTYSFYNLKKASPERVVSELVQIAYSIEPVISGVKGKKEIFETKSGSLIERLKLIDEKEKIKFLESFRKEYIGSWHEGFVHGFYDPNCDGRSKKVYIINIMDYFNEKSKQKIVKQLSFSF